MFTTCVIGDGLPLCVGNKTSYSQSLCMFATCVIGDGLPLCVGNKTSHSQSLSLCECLPPVSLGKGCLCALETRHLTASLSVFVNVYHLRHWGRVASVRWKQDISQPVSVFVNVYHLCHWGRVASVCWKQDISQPVSQSL